MYVCANTVHTLSVCTAVGTYVYMTSYAMYVCVPLQMWFCPLIGDLLGIPCVQGGTYIVHNVALLCHLMQQRFDIFERFHT